MSTRTTRSRAKLLEAPSPAWDDLVGPGDLYQSRRWLEVERRLDGGSDALLAAVTEGATPVAGCALYLGGPRRRGSPLGSLGGVLATVAGDADARLRRAAERCEPSAVIGSRRPGYSSIMVAPGHDGDGIATLLEAAEAHATERGAASLALPYVDDDRRDLRGVLERRGYDTLQAFRCARLELEGTSFDDYLDSLATSRRARKVRAEDRALAAAGLRYELEPLRPRLVESLVPLEMRLYARYGTAFPEPDVRALHHAVLESFADDAVVVSGLLDGERVGFTVAVAHQDTLYCRQAGFDYDRTGRLPVYFGVVFYAVIRLAHELGARTIVYGIGSEQGKELRGCSMVPQHTYWTSLPATDHRSGGRDE